MKIITAVLFTVMMFLQGCGSDNSTSPKDRDMSERDIPAPIYQVLVQGTYPHNPMFYEADKKFSFDIFYSDNSDDVNAFSSLYKNLTGKEVPVFDGAMVIARAGLRSTGGYMLELEDVIQKEDSVTLVFHEKKPKPMDMVTMALTYPYMVVVIPEYFGDVKVVTK